MIEISNLHAKYGEKVVLAGINIQIKKGDITAIIGPNGAGKSTLLRCMARQLRANSGEIKLAGQDIFFLSPTAFAKQVSYLKQMHAAPALPVEALVLHGRFPHTKFLRIYSDDDRNIAKAAMQQTGVWQLRHKYANELSGGELQKVYLAMLLCQNTPVLLLDEPSTYLDIGRHMELFALLSDLKNAGKTIIVVLHDIAAALKIADQVCLLTDSALAFSGTPAALIQSGLIDSVYGVRSAVVEYEGEPFFVVPFSTKWQSHFVE